MKNMGQIETLGRMMNSDADRLKLECQACGHKTEYARRDAWTIWGMNATPHSIRKRAKCIRCGERVLISVTV
jgi:DNA-directed RNA polymerase subunit RPC12/RpoP